MLAAKSSIPSCDSLVQQIDRWFGLLRKCGVDVSTSAADCFHRCDACRSGKTKKRANCQGGRLKIDTSTPIRFVSNQDGRSLKVTVTAATQWSKSSSRFPQKHSVEVEVSCDGEPTKYRAHLDLATHSGREPLFHLQTGGFRSEKIAEEKHFGLLRWPVIPLDVILVTELILYTFQYEQWKDVHQDSEFLNALRPSEERFLAPFFQDLWSSPEDRDRSFLATFSSFHEPARMPSFTSRPRRK